MDYKGELSWRGGDQSGPKEGGRDEGRKSVWSQNLDGVVILPRVYRDWISSKNFWSEARVARAAKPLKIGRLFCKSVT